MNTMKIKQKPFCYKKYYGKGFFEFELDNRNNPKE